MAAGLLIGEVQGGRKTCGPLSYRQHGAPGSLQTEKGICYGPAPILSRGCFHRMQGFSHDGEEQHDLGWSHRLAWPRTEPSQGLNTGSNPVGTTTLSLHGGSRVERRSARSIR